MITRARDITHDEIRDLVGADASYIIEIGANDGTDTIEMVKRFPDALIQCFECDPRAIAKFRRRVYPPPGSPRLPIPVMLHEVALADRTGYYRFFPSDGAPGTQVENWDKSGSLCRPTGHLKRSPEITFREPIVVECCLLDDVALRRAAIDLIWIDVQGAERLVFNGGKETLARTRFLKVECHRKELYEGQFTETELLDYLQGWECLGRWADDLVLVNRRLAHA